MVAQVAHPQEFLVPHLEPNIGDAVNYANFMAWATVQTLRFLGWAVKG